MDQDAKKTALRMIPYPPSPAVREGGIAVSPCACG
jgi:hypothetical protein